MNPEDDADRHGAGPLAELPRALDPDRLVLSRGNLFSVTTTTGDIAPAGARELGLFHQDTRHLSHYEIVLPGPPPRARGLARRRSCSIRARPAALKCRATVH